ncbi:hypothetical protein [Halolamina sediminis]|jgi:hypothetical protein|uniref:hypothetical protein n=1 Tax=Halolamina sediminis TaxID=1480675 RepID=UPI0006B3FF64|nr:hypothetical protein [Halolamina sediminis]
MSSTRRKLAVRLLRTDWSEWNRSLRAKLLSPVFVLLGGLTSVLLQTGLAHGGAEPRLDGVVTGVFAVGSLVLGLVVLALVD